ncbi:Protein YIPF [Caenorhabditis elegans]|uniref:Protein YIPF n=1 Tax=Caenorhabditis elegans TaxID=6239 RepID=Q9U1Y8_CAEEL|nr:Protein YIPF [Caenorhabditis elegans]CAB60403.3 Protein YIPF [Caenorhabditis elegans]|eukprot:NP_507855.2 Protein YIPF [Caenorhabditis elegans]
MDYPGTGVKQPEVSIDLNGFYSSNFEQFEHPDQSSNAPNSGSISSPTGQISAQAYRRTNAGAAGKFMENSGFGWLLEVNEEDSDQIPLLEELDIDLTDIYYKIRCVLLPLPYFRMKLNIVVSWIITIWFCGGFMVYFIARALGGDVGYSQVLGIVGYCLIPLVVTSLITPLFSSFRLLSNGLGMFGTIWSVYSAGTLLCVDELQAKKPLVVYPVFLLYIYFYSLYSGV